MEGRQETAPAATGANGRWTVGSRRAPVADPWRGSKVSPLKAHFASAARELPPNRSLPMDHRSLQLPRRLLLALPLLALAACGGGDADATAGGGSGSSDGDRPRVAVVPKGTTHTFWQSVKRGADAAGAELGVEVIWKAQLDEGDRAGQIQVVQQLVGDGIDLLCLAPLDAQALARPVADARAAGVDVLIFDSLLEGEPGTDFLGYVGTDNEAAGRLGAQALVETMGTEGRVVLLRYRVGSASTEARERGFLDAIAQHPGIEVVVEDRYAGASSSSAQAEALNLMPQLREADGVFCSQESATVGMLLALRREGLLDDLAFVGFDSSQPLVQGLRDGELDALIVQDPVRMGELSVRLAKQHLDGAAVPAMTDTGCVIVRADDLDDPRIASLVE